MDAITFSQVSKSYGSVRAVDGLDLTIGVGRTVALLGPNGAGKSTSIGMLLGLVRPSAGTVRLFGDTPDAAVTAGWVGAMPQGDAPIEGLTVREVVDFVRRLYPRPLSLDAVLRTADLVALAGRRVDRLSGGQAKRVSFALVRCPRTFAGSGHAALGRGRPQRCCRSLRTRARSRRWAASTSG